MEQLKLTPGGTQLNRNSLDVWRQSLRVGQRVHVVVADKLSSGLLQLRIGSNQVTARTDISAKTGATLTLEVTKLGSVLSFNIIDSALEGTRHSTPAEGYRKQLTALQGSILAPVHALWRPTPHSAKILSLLGMSDAELESLFIPLARSELPVPDAMKSAVLQSGLFLESQLLSVLNSGGLLSSGDLKAALLILLAKVNRRLSRLSPDQKNGSDEDLLPQFLGELEGALATITLRQLAMLNADDLGRLVVAVEIPYKSHDGLAGISLRIERENKASAEEREETWKILVSANPANLGPIEAELFLCGNNLAIVIYVEQIETARLVGLGLDGLRSGLQRQGMKVSVLRCQEGSRPKEADINRWPLCVDERV